MFQDSSGPLWLRNTMWWQQRPERIPQLRQRYLSRINTALQSAAYSSGGSLRLTERPDHSSYLNKLLVGKAIAFGVIANFTTNHKVVLAVPYTVILAV